MRAMSSALCEPRSARLAPLWPPFHLMVGCSDGAEGRGREGLFRLVWGTKRGQKAVSRVWNLRRPNLCHASTQKSPKDLIWVLTSTYVSDTGNLSNTSEGVSLASQATARQVCKSAQRLCAVEESVDHCFAGFVFLSFDQTSADLRSPQYHGNLQPACPDALNQDTSCRAHPDISVTGLSHDAQRNSNLFKTYIVINVFREYNS